MCPRRRALRFRGFTLIELLIVVAIISMLAALAILGYRRYIHAAQSSEARVVMGLIRSGEESYRQDTNAYLSCSQNMSEYYPNTSPDDTRRPWERTGDPKYDCWAQLGVHPDAPVRYGYALMAGTAPKTPGKLDSDFATPPLWPTTLPDGTPWFQVAARNKHRKSMGPSLAVSTSFDGTVYTEGDGN